MRGEDYYLPNEVGEAMTIKAMEAWTMPVSPRAILSTLNEEERKEDQHVKLWFALLHE